MEIVPVIRRESWIAAIAVRNSRSCMSTSRLPNHLANLPPSLGGSSRLAIHTSICTAPISASPKRWSAAQTSRQSGAGRPSASTTATTTSAGSAARDSSQSRSAR